jgi:hypothetical protein
MMVSKLLLQRRLFRFLQLSPYSLCSFSSSSSLHGSPFHSVKATEILNPLTSSRSFCSRKSNLVDQFHGPAPIDYRYDTSFCVFRSYVVLWFIKTLQIWNLSKLLLFLKAKEIVLSLWIFVTFLKNKSVWIMFLKIQMLVAITNASLAINAQCWLK